MKTNKKYDAVVRDREARIELLNKTIEDQNHRLAAQESELRRLREVLSDKTAAIREYERFTQCIKDACDGLGED